MKPAQVLASVLLFTALSLGQQPAGSPQDRAANPGDQTYNQPTDTGHNWGGWGLLGLLGLAGLMGRNKRETTNIDTGYTRDDRTYGGGQRRVG